MGSRQIVLVSTAGFSVLNARIFWQEAKTKRFFSQCTVCNCSSHHVVGIHGRAGGCSTTTVYKGIDHSLPLGLEPPTFPRGSVSTCVANLIIQLLNRLDHAHSI
jgi:hypothetical protein